jgi:cyanophycinase-like exopeptidase
MNDKPKPVFLLAGGRRSRGKGQDTLLQAVFQSYGIKAPTVAYSGTASGDDRNFFGWIANELKVGGAGKIVHAVISSPGADMKKAKNILESADIVFISGGDVEAGMEILQEKKMIDFLTGLYRQGKPFFGISAGALMLANKWVRWPDPKDDDFAELFPCLGFAPVICDAHDEQSGWEELKVALMLEKEGIVGHGMTSGSGIKVTSDSNVTLVGGTVNRYIKQGNKVVKIVDL